MIQSVSPTKTNVSAFLASQVKIPHSQHMFQCWIKGLRLGRTPSGTRVSVVETFVRQEITVIVSGSQNFGSGGYRASCVFAGSKPEILDVWEAEDQFISQTCARLIVTGPCVIFQAESDDVGNGRNWHTAYLCTSR